jgi:hypothetical protein
MKLSKKIRKLVKDAQALEAKQRDDEWSEIEYKMAQADVKYLRHFIVSIGLDPDGDYSVFYMTLFANAIEKVLR